MRFFPDIAMRGSLMLMLNADTVNGGLSLNEKIYPDFGAEPDGPSRAHEIRFRWGGSTSEVWM